MKKVVFLFTMFFAFAVAASAQTLSIGAVMENFSLSDLSG